MKETHLERVKQYALNRLEKELSPNLIYHGIAHTRDDVVPAAIRLAELENVQGEDFILLMTAAWLHDIGFVVQAIYHELIGARIASQVLPGFGYNEEQIEVVKWAIMATALPQSPLNLIDKILADSDLDVLGREDIFMDRNNRLRRELATTGKNFTDSEWYSSQLKFVESHNYFTPSAHRLRDAGKAANIAILRGLLKA